MGEIQIDGGAIGGYSDFQGGAILESGKNVIEAAPSGTCLMPDLRGGLLLGAALVPEVLVPELFCPGVTERLFPNASAQIQVNGMPLGPEVIPPAPGKVAFLKANPLRR